ncbi:MAG: hypothetical protein AM1032_000344 [Mycoplasmataceae bacterium]|nr:MAG: hypothetical protein AM1032_000344 [Mycoplasmataceae bacterium]
MTNTQRWLDEKYPIEKIEKLQNDLIALEKEINENNHELNATLE